MAIFGVSSENGSVDEIKQCQFGWYISSNEAVWRILSFPIHERHPTVVHLAVHLENGQRVYFTTENVLERAATPPPTTLTVFFSFHYAELIHLPKHCYIQTYQHISLGMHQKKNFNNANRERKLNVNKIYFQHKLWEDYILFIQIRQNVIICVCYW